MPKMNFVLADTTALAMEEGLSIVAQNASLDKFGSHIVLVPDSKTIMAEHRLLQMVNDGAFANIYIYSLKRLLKKISSINNQAVLTKVGGTMIVKKIAIENIDNLVCFKRAANSNGFAEVMFATISQLKSSGVGVAEFYQMIENMPTASKLKMQDVALIYSEYQKYIENKYYDDNDLLDILAEVVKLSDFVKDSSVYFLGYESVTSGQLKVCRSIIENAKSFLVSASFGAEGANSHIRDNEVYVKFKAIADEQNFYYNPKRTKHNFSADFNHIKNNLYAYPAAVRQGSEAVEILEASTLAAEVEFVTEKIANLVHNGSRYRQIAVLAPQEYHRAISQSLTDSGIVNFVAEPYSFSGHALFRLIVSCLEVVRKNYDQTAVIELASNILLKGQEDISDFINYINKYGINHSKFCKKFDKFDDKIINNDTFLQIEAKREQICKIVAPFYKADGTCLGYVQAIRQILADLNIADKLQNLLDLQQNDPVEANITSQALGKLENVLEQIQTFLAAEKIGLDGLESILLAGLDVNDISLVPVSQDCIIIGSSIDGLFDIDHLFILGAKEGAFPVKFADCGIILDKDIANLSGGAQNTIEPTIRTINRRERYKAYEALLLPQKSVVLSYNTGSAEENNRISGLVQNLINIFGGEDVLKVQKYAGQFNFDVQHLSQSIKQQLCTKINVQKYLCKQVGNFLQTQNFEDPGLVNTVWHSIKENLPKVISSRISSINNPPSYNIDHAEQLYFFKDKTSTSQLERYFTCPFLFFTDYGLRLKENETSRLRALDVGTILHAVAEQFVAKFAKNNNINVADAATKIIDQILESQFVVADNKYLVKLLRQESIRLCDKLADEILHSHFKPIGLEQGFGEGMQYPAVRLKCANKKLNLEGKIDRIDAFNGLFRIIDYKTGKIEDNIKRIYYGKKIQLVTYLMAMQKSGLKPAAVVYYPIRNEFSSAENTSGRMQGLFLDNAEVIMAMDTRLGQDNPTSSTLSIKLNKGKKGECALRKSVNVLSDGQFSNLCSYVTKLCQTAVDEILQGYVMPSPVKVSASDRLKCATCPYLAVCGVKNSVYAQGRKCYTDVKIDAIDNLIEAQDKGGSNG